MASFVHLHLHSEYSLLDGVCKVSEIPKKAKECGHTAVAITDHGALYGAVNFYKACKSEGIKPIIGCEVYVAQNTRFDKVYGTDSSPYHLTLLCKNEIGYRNLMKLVSLGFSEGFYLKPRIDKELLFKYHEGLIALSGCLGGKIPSLIAKGMLQDAIKEAIEMQKVFGPDFYLELQNHGREDQIRINKVYRTLHDRFGIPLVATNDVHYLNQSDYETQMTMLCIQTGTKLSDGHHVGFETNSFYYKTTEEMSALFIGYEDALENTAKIAEECNLDFTFGKYYLPAYDPEDGSSPADHLRRLALNGYQKRVERGDIVQSEKAGEKAYLERMEYELGVIIGMGYSDYYLIVQDFVNYAKSQGIPVGPGRGSGAGSLVAYFLSITDVDPIRYGLIFERFLNPERVSMPDFDIDFCFIRREEVIKYVAEKYGSDRVCQIITFGTLKAKAAIRDAARAMGLPYADGDTVIKAMPKHYTVTIAEAEKTKDMQTLMASSEALARLVRTAKKLEGLPRNISTHAAGVVISDRPVSDYVPTAMSGETSVTQYDMDTVAELGLLKFDFLGLRTLTVIADAERMIRRREPSFSVTSAPENDEKTFEMLRAGQTTGIFQLESAGMRRMLIQFEPSSIEDIMIALSMYRPGPMEAIPKLLENRRKGKIEYALPQLAEILDSTYGCVVYQEQVMQIFRSLASYSFGKADVVRKAISKKKPEVIAKQRADFICGCVENGIDEGCAAELFDELTAFAGYAFNKSHAAAYSVIAYRTAYLKAHYPAEFFAALMTSELNNHTKLSQYILEANRLGITLLPPSVNESAVDFNEDGGNIRYGLSALKNVGIGFVTGMLAERNKNGPFLTFADFCERMLGKDLNKKQIETFIKAGAFDCLGIYRSRLLERYTDVLDRAAAKQKEYVSGQMSLFTTEEATKDEHSGFSDLPEFSLRVRLNLEYEASGMYFSGHLTDEYSECEKDIGAVPVASILGSFESDEDGESETVGDYKNGQSVPVIGVIRSVNVKISKKGEKFAFVGLQDRTGEIELLLFSSVYAEYYPLLVTDSVVAVYGKITVGEEDGVKLIVSAITPIKPNGKYEHGASPFASLQGDGRNRYNRKSKNTAETASAASVKTASASQNQAQTEPEEKRRLYLRVSSVTSQEAVNALAVIEATKGGIPVIFYDAKQGKYVKRSDLAIAYSEKALAALRRLLGDENVVIKSKE